jgi:hypothetical protein
MKGGLMAALHLFARLTAQNSSISIEFVCDSL